MARSAAEAASLADNGAHADAGALDDDNTAPLLGPEEHRRHTDAHERDAGATDGSAAFGGVSPGRQFRAVLRKTYILKTRSTLCCCGGWTALAIEVLLPVAFFLLMCLPKALVKPMDTALDLEQALPLNSPLWSNCYLCGRGSSDCIMTPQGHSHILYVPAGDNATEEAVDSVARSLACSMTTGFDTILLNRTLQEAYQLLHNLSVRHVPQVDSSLASSFPEIFLDDSQGEQWVAKCRTLEHCHTAECTQPFRDKFAGFASEDEAVDYVKSNPEQVTAVLVFDFEPDAIQVTIRMNQSDTPSTRELFPLFPVAPDNRQQCGDGLYPNGTYWYFSNLQSVVDQGLMNYVLQTGEGEAPLVVEPWIKTFPWPEYSLDLGAAVASLILRVLVIFAFILPFYTSVGAIVTEKELRLREGMRLFGLQESAYWASWGLTHFVGLAISSVGMTLVGRYPFEYSSMSLLLVFYLELSVALIVFAYFVSTLFSKARVAGTASVLIYVASMIPGYLMLPLQPYGGHGRLLSCLFPPGAATIFSEILLKLELGEVGVTWQSLYLGITEDNPTTMAQVMLMLLVDIVLYTLLTFYCDHVIPSEFGTALPFYFPLQPSYWRFSGCCAGGGRHDSGEGEAAEPSRMAETLLPIAEEHAPPAQAAAVSIRKLRKVFRTTTGPKVAVDDLSMDIYSSQITALLGHNGAGKTTTISMISGMLQATSGEVFVHELSMSKDMQRIRRSLGLCPQFDILWPSLTVREHLRMYADFKGVARELREREVLRAVREVDLEEKLNEMAGTLSGGQRRKLSVAIAFIGRPHVVFLDEPTSGMDPYSRRFTWDVIRRNKAGRVVVLTTHFLDEADILSDRVAIMSQGRLAALGTPLELKSRYGAGYTLTIVRAEGVPEEDKAVVVERQRAAVAAHVPEAVVVSSVGSELSLKLPKESSAQFPAMLRALEDDANGDLGVGSFGVSITTLEEVFLLLEKINSRDGGASKTPTATNSNIKGNSRRSGSKVAQLEDADEEDDLHHGEADGEEDSAGEGVPLLSTGEETLQTQQSYFAHHAGQRRGQKSAQFRALLWKRWINAKRDRLMILTQLLTPIAFVLLALLGGKATSSLTHPPSLVISRDSVLKGHQAPVAHTESFASAGEEYELESYQLVDAEQYEQLWALSLECANCTGWLYDLREVAGKLLQHGHLTINTFYSDRECPAACPVGTFDDWLLQHWGDNKLRYDALFLQEPWQRPLPSNVNATLPPQQEDVLQLLAAHSLQLAAAAGDGDPVPPPFPLNMLVAGGNGQASGADSDSDGEGDDGDSSGRWPPPPTMMPQVLLPPTANRSFTLLLNSSAYHGIPAALRDADNALLAKEVPPGAALTELRLVSAPFPVLPDEARAQASEDIEQLLLTVCVAMAVSVLSASFAVFLVKERASNAKHVQMISGVDGFLFWCSAFLFDLLGYVLSALCIVVCFVAFQLDYYQGQNLAAVVVLLLLFGLAALPQTYALQFLFRDEMSALTRLIIVYFVFAFLAVLVNLMLQALADPSVGVKGAGDALDVTQWAFRVLSPHYCLCKGLADIQTNYNEQDSGLPASLTNAYDSAFALNVTGYHMLFLVLHAVAWSLLTLAIEYQYFRTLTHRLTDLLAPRRRSQAAGANRSTDAGAEDGSAAARSSFSFGHLQSGESHTDLTVLESGQMVHEDVDVAKESERVRQLGARDGADVVVAKQLKKRYAGSATYSVNGISFGVRCGEVFGLLGVNGAGKTTTFNMLTGDVLPTEGDASVCGHSVTAERSQSRRHLGYCPQFDATQANMTGREHLLFYSQLRGVPRAAQAALVASLISKLGLTPYADRTAGTYSGGNRRKLSVGIALVGNPPVVLLDEPSTGMDPAARRSMWKVISDTMRDRAVVLTSHSMEECEALCSRIGIMVAGAFRCLGSVQHLKNRFGSGYTIEFRTNSAAQRAAVERSVAEALPRAVLQESSDGHLSFNLKAEDTRLSELFERIEDMRERTAFEDYGVSQSSLEQVFVRFAAANEHEREREREHMLPREC